MSEYQRGDQRSDEHPVVLGEARDDVRRHQIVRRPGDDRQDRAHHGPCERDARGGDGTGGVGDEWSVRPHRAGGGEHRGGLGGIAHGEHAFGSEPVARVGGEWSEEDGGAELDGGDDTRLVHSAALVGEHEHRQPGRVFGEGEADE